MKVFNIRTLGCKVNQCDSQEIRERLCRFGWAESPDAAKADVCIINTCCVTSRAERKSRNAIRAAVRVNRKARVAVTGCYTRYDKTALRKIDGVSDIFEDNRKKELFAWAQSLFNAPGSDHKSTLSFSLGKRTRGFLKIQEGCDNRCSYCVVPFVRGPSRSKEAVSVLDEARGLVFAGHKEIVLTGVCLGSFGKDLFPAMDLVDIMTELEKIDGLERIRLSSVEPQDISDKLIDKIASSPKICPHLHIPFQSGDDSVLASMNKRLRRGDYKGIVARARKSIKDLSITCDFIIGYPLEGEENFKNTIEFLEFLEPLKTHHFTYSPRLGTVSHDRGSELSGALVKNRSLVFEKRSQELADNYKKRYVGKDIKVLFEKKVGGEWQGYSSNYMLVRGPSGGPLRNEVRRVEVTGLEGGVLCGKIIT